MPLSDLLDVEALRGPLSADAPAGIDLRSDDAGRRAWSEIRQLRDDARRIERDADADPKVERSAAQPLWANVVGRTAGVLRETSRDLTVAAMLIESIARIDGFGGLADGLDVARALVDSQWSVLFPLPDPDDGPIDESTTTAARAMPLVRLAGEEGDGLLVPAILHIPLVNGRDGQRYGLGHWRISKRGGESASLADPEKRSLAEERGWLSPEAFGKAVSETSGDFIRATFRDLLRARESWRSLAASVAKESGDLAILPTLPIETLFEECADAMKTMTPGLGAAAAPETAPGDDQTPSQEDHPPGGVARRGGSREDVLRSLEEAAVFFERLDPHSLLAAQVRNVVRMARLPREMYYQELVEDSAALRSIGRLTGLAFDGGGTGRDGE
jgi:type VI secretion system protein ImpA